MFMSNIFWSTASTTYPPDMLLTGIARIYRNKMRTTGPARSLMRQFSFMLFISIIIIFMYKYRKCRNVLTWTDWTSTHISIVQFPSNNTKYGCSPKAFLTNNKAAINIIIDLILWVKIMHHHLWIYSSINIGIVKQHQLDNVTLY